MKGLVGSLIVVAAAALAQPLPPVGALAAPPRTITVVPTQPLSFGAFAAGPLGGTVSISPLGARATAGVFPVGNDPFGPASFVVTIPTGSTHYTILLPPPTVLTCSANGAAMQLDSFSSDPVVAGKVSGGTRQQILSLGATLHVAQGQPAGDYSGTFNVTVDLAN